jgi:predicted lysophospholipase L1 biosynthesis ABC-type transport system permease subunit
VLGVVIGLIGAIALTRLMTSLLFEVNAMSLSPLIFSIAAMVLVAVAMAGSYGMSSMIRSSLAVLLSTSLLTSIGWVIR